MSKTKHLMRSQVAAAAIAIAATSGASAGGFGGIKIGGVTINPFNPVQPIQPPPVKVGPVTVTPPAPSIIPSPPKVVIEGSGEIAKAAGKATDVADNARAVADKAAQDTGKALDKATQDSGKAIEKATQDIGKTAEKALHDTGKTAEKAGQDVVVAGRAIGEFVQNQIRGYGDSLSDAEKRVREGKIVGAIWHASTDDFKHTDQNAAKAAQESVILRTVGQVAATAYGGPGGAAAFAAWYTYHQTGDAELALRIGLITGAASAGFSAAGQLPSGTATQLAQKVIVTGAIGGLAVAAAGGDEAAVRDGFLLSGGMVLVQEGYQKATHHDLDARASKGGPYCMATVGAKCSPDVSAYERDANGNILYDEKGDPKVDVTKTDPRRTHVGTWAKAGDAPIVGVNEQSGTMIAVSKVPGMNAMSVFHDQWSVSWDMDAFTRVVTIVPAVVLTYTGTGAPYYDTLQQASVNGANRGKTSQAATEVYDDLPTPDDDLPREATKAPVQVYDDLPTADDDLPPEP